VRFKRYQNPVWPGEFADPFVLAVESVYYAYGTARLGNDGRPFPVLRSFDLVDWEPLGGALKPLEDPPALSYWAPEVLHHNGRFYLYYSASSIPSDEGHRLRVAIADHPAGPFVDTGKLLLPDLGFSIDASPFRDPRSGDYYLFFAMDYESDEPTGTGVAVVRLGSDPTQVIGAPQLVVRASQPWQVYQQNRSYKGRVWPVWNCIEGPCALEREGRYFCLFSGGAWHSDNYGVGCATADHPLGPWREIASPDAGPSVLRAIPGQVLGPGHNSVVLGPDNKTLFMVYHAWNASRDFRRIYIDPIRWTDQGPHVDGPSIATRELLIA
jgi:beta-xylosidase